MFFLFLLIMDTKVSLFTMRQMEKKSKKKKEVVVENKNKCGLSARTEGEIDGMMGWDERRREGGSGRRKEPRRGNPSEKGDESC